MKNIKKFENFENSSSLIPKDILDKLNSTDHKDILETIHDFENELKGDQDFSKMFAYVDDIGIWLDDTSMSVQEADDIYFRLCKLVQDCGKDF